MYTYLGVHECAMKRGLIRQAIRSRDTYRSSKPGSIRPRDNTYMYMYMLFQAGEYGRATCQPS